ncbi:MAG: zinc-binding dehydrogenase [Candidatus Omnitrophica bacterium]|nr:zinc-binding dehydrogenase [Candidatus Omnitrophota bacterium]
MKAIAFDHHGGVEVLKYLEVPAPRMGEDEALIEVEACGINHLDLWTRQGLPGVQVPMPHILGCEVVGKVAKVGAKVTHVKKGDRVLAAPGISCGSCPACQGGRDSLCREFKIMGLQRDGGYAEMVSAPGKNLIPVSSKLKPEEWAAVPLVFVTAWHMLVTRAGLKAGESVLIHAGGSGVGSAAIQVARLSGATVFATVGSDEKLKKAKALGAHWVINYNRRDFPEEVQRLTEGRGVDVVFEHIGPATWRGSMKCLARGGRLVTCGATTGPLVELDLRFFFTRELSVMGCYMGGRRELDQVLGLAAEGRLKPVVDTVFPLKEAARAQAVMQSRNFFGKLVLKV